MVHTLKKHLLVVLLNQWTFKSVALLLGHGCKGRTSWWCNMKDTEDVHYAADKGCSWHRLHRPHPPRPEKQWMEAQREAGRPELRWNTLGQLQTLTSAGKTGKKAEYKAIYLEKEKLQNKTGSGELSVEMTKHTGGKCPWCKSPSEESVTKLQKFTRGKSHDGGLRGGGGATSSLQLTWAAVGCRPTHARLPLYQGSHRTVLMWPDVICLTSLFLKNRIWNESNQSKTKKPFSLRTFQLHGSVLARHSSSPAPSAKS